MAKSIDYVRRMEVSESGAGWGDTATAAFDGADTSRICHAAAAPAAAAVERLPDETHLTQRCRDAIDQKNCY